MKKHVCLLLLVAFCFNPLHAQQDAAGDVKQAMATITNADVIRQVKEISADSMQGRQPFTIGEERAINYLKREFIKLGLKPAFKGSYFQDVPLVEVRTTPIDSLITIKSKTGVVELKYNDELIAMSRHFVKEISCKNSDIVFAGYGVKAPEYNWNDYEGINVVGKTVLVLVNDPGFMTNDSTIFKGRTMTYYGRWTYKFEEATRQGAAAIIIIHSNEAAGYNFAIPQRMIVGPNLYLDAKDKYASRPKLEGWITWDAADKVFKLCGLNLTELALKANKRGFKALPLNATLSMNIKSVQKLNVTKNVGGVIEGTQRPDECIVYSAHWDHLGIGKVVDGDSIYNGAVDNGTSLAWMLQVAKAFSNLKTKPQRSILFFAPTAEESGLMGSEYYAQHPAFAIEKTVANINNDLILPTGKYKDVMVVGWGQSELEDYVAEVAKEQDRYLLPDPNSHTGMYFRSDHYNFAKVGIPSLYVRGNADSREKGKEYAAEKEKQYLATGYHKPQDQFDEKTWNVDNVVEDAQLVFKVGYKLSNEKTFPQWKEGSEFKAIRQKK